MDSTRPIRALIRGLDALTVLNLDSVPGDALLKELLAVEDIKSAQVVQL